MKSKYFHTATIMAVCLILFSAFKYHSFNYQVLSCSPNSISGTAGELLTQASGTLQKAKGKSAASTYTIEGTKSLTTRFNMTNPCFQILGSTGQPDPSMYISIYKLSVGKNNRSFTINNDGSNNASMITLSITLVEANKYSIDIMGGVVLQTGEYAFVDKSTTTSSGNVTVWTFGID